MSWATASWAYSNASSGGGTTLPADAAGVLANDGVGTLSWLAFPFTVAQGGTGLATVAAGCLPYASAADTLACIASSSTVGQTLRVTAANTYGWGALDLADADAVTGVLPAANYATMVGDSGAGGTKGAVPAPAAGDAAAGKYLKADGVWTAPGGSPAGSGSELQYRNAGAFGAVTGTTVGGTNQRIAVQAQAATEVPLTVQGAASQTANLQAWQNSAGTVVGGATSGGNIFVGAAGAYSGAGIGPTGVTGTLTLADGLYFTYGGNEQLRAYHAIELRGGAGGATVAAGTTANANTVVINNDATDVGLTVKGAAAQTANLQEWQNSSGTVLARVTSVGVLASPHATFSTSEVFGIGATATNGAGVAIGQATSVGDSSVAVGYNAICGGAWSVAIGASAGCQDRTVAVGKGAIPTASNQIVIGTTPNGAMTQYPAAVIASTTYSHTLNGMGGSGTNIAGGAELVAGGKGTGNAAGGATGFQSSYPGASGTTLQTLTDRVTIPSKWTTLTESSATAIATLTYAASTAVGAEFLVTVQADDGTDYQSMTYRVAVNSVRKATGNTVTTEAVLGTPPLAAETAGASTLTCTFDDTEGASAAVLNANCVSSLVQTTLRATIQAQVNGPALVTQP